MSGALYNLQYVIPRVDFDSAASKIESVEFKVGILYLGSTDGYLLQYGVEERQNEEGNSVLLSNFIQKKYLGEKSKISFLSAAPALNTIIVVCGGNLSLLDMSTLEPKPGFHNKLKGISCCVVDSMAEDHFSVRICVSKKKQVVLYNIDEEKMSLIRSRELNEPIVNLSISGDTVCVATHSRYLILNVKTGGVIDLFPIEEHSTSYMITQIQNQEFLVAGPGNLGMFVTGEGTSQRPPIQLTANLYRIIYSSPYIIGLSPESVLIYSLQDGKVKQGISYPGGRTLGVFDGTILVSGSSQISAILPIPWQAQAENFLRQENVSDVLELLKSLHISSDEAKLKERSIRQKAGFICLSKGDLTQARRLLTEGHVDPREIITLYPDIRSPNSRYIPISPPLHNIPDISSVRPEAGEPDVHQFLLQYLLDISQLNQESERESVADAQLDPDHEEIVHTCIAKLYALYYPEKLETFLKQDTVLLNTEDLADFFQNRDFMHFQALLHEKLNENKEAISIWSGLISGQSVDPFFPGVQFVIRRLCVLDASLCWSHCDVILEANQELGVELFIKHQLSAQDDFIDTALDTLRKFPKARRIYLEHLVLNKKSQVEQHHNLLALMLIEDYKNSDSSNKLRTLILSSTHLNMLFLLDKLRGTSLHYESAILLGRMARYSEALHLLINQLGDHDLALSFCDDIASRLQKKEKEDLMFQLLSIYLNPSDQANKQEYLVKAIDLMNSRAGDFNGSQVLNSLPANWNIASILPAIKVFIRQSNQEHRSTQISKALHKGNNVNLKSEYLAITSQPIHILPNHYCISCKKGFAGTRVSRYPNGVMLHEQCVINKKICPLTGQIFELSV